MSGGVAVSNRIADLDAGSWERASGPGIALDPGLLAAMDEADRLAPQRRYFLRRSADGAAAAAATLRVGPAAARSLDALLFGRAATLVRAFGGGSAPVLLASPDLGYDATMHARSAAGEIAASRQLLHELCAAMEAEARRERAAVCVTRVDAAACPGLVETLSERGYAQTLDRPTTWMSVEWADLEGYFEHLGATGRTGRGKLRREMTRYRDSGGRLEAIAGSGVDAARIAALLEQHQRRWNGEGLGLGTEFVALLLRHMAERVHVYVSGAATDAGATALLLRRGERGALALVGIDHARPLPDFAYFNLAYYGPAGDAPGLGLRRIDFGPGMVEMKLRRGCRVAFPRIFYRAHSSLGRRWRRTALAVHRGWFERKFRALRADGSAG